MGIERGDVVEVVTAGNEHLLMRALGAAMMGRYFEVVWVATFSEWDRALRTGEEPDGLPWPTDALWLAEPGTRFNGFGALSAG